MTHILKAFPKQSSQHLVLFEPDRRGTDFERVEDIAADAIAAAREAAALLGLLGSGHTVVDDLAYEIRLAIVFSQMLEAILGKDWTLEQCTPDNIAAFLDGLNESPTATKH